MSSAGSFAWKRFGPLLLLLLWLGVAGSVQAHGLRVHAQLEGNAVHGRAWYSDDSPAVGERASLHRPEPDSMELAVTRTDAQGRFVLPAPPEAALRLVVEGDEGHREELMLAAPVTALPGSPWQAELRRELQPLREDIARLQQRIRIGDLLAGVGLIVGLAGGWALWRSRGRR